MQRHTHAATLSIDPARPYASHASARRAGARRRRGLAVLAVALAALLAIAGPAGADPGSFEAAHPDDDPEPGGNFKQPDPPEPSVSLSLTPVCTPDGRFAYEITVAHPPAGNTAVELQWREPGGQVSKVAGAAGLVVSGEGTFEARGVLHYQGPGFYSSDWQQTNVDCGDDDEPGEPGENGSGTRSTGKTSDPLDEIVRAEPNFTG